MQCRAVPPEFVEVDDPASPWRGRLGHIVRSDHAGTWWRDHLTGTEVLFAGPQPRDDRSSGSPPPPRSNP